MKITKYDIHSPVLQKVAEFIWHITCDENISADRLLPVVNTDLIINISKPIYYTSVDGEKIKAPAQHIRNIKLQPQSIDQEACDVWGVSLHPYGAYSLLGGNMSDHSERIIDLQKCNPPLSTALSESMQEGFDECSGAVRIDRVLSQHIMMPIRENDYKTMNHFLLTMLQYKIGEYCEKNDIHIKQLERLCKKYTGLSPKQLQRIARFQKASNEMLYQDKVPAIADVAYFYEYADQMHLTKTFQKYTGVSPFQFLNNHNSIKEKLHHKGK